MNPTNQAILQNKFFTTPTLAEFRRGLAMRNSRMIIKQMVDEEDAERELLAQADDYTYGDNVDREQ